MGTIEAALERMRAAEAPAMEPVTGRPPAPPRSVALLSGSFDPVTVGHVALADAALATSEVGVFVYSVRTLPKEGPSAGHAALLSESDRLRALIRVCERDVRFATAVCSRGLLADQVEAAAVAFPNAALSVIVGSDKLLQLFDPRWYEDRDAVIATLLDLAHVRYGLRAGDEEAVRALLGRADVRPWLERLDPLDVPPDVTAISSRRVRELIRAGADVTGLVPPEVRPILSAAAQAGGSPLA
jgi:nicotinic acid mononucleotide adenylyltransferase